MIVGCYTMDLYCDNEETEHPYDEFPHQFTGHTEGICKKKAREAGWVFKLDGTVVCPLCKGTKNGKEKT